MLKAEDPEVPALEVSCQTRPLALLLMGLGILEEAKVLKLDPWAFGQCSPCEW